MTREDIHEAAKNDADDAGSKPSDGAAVSEGGSGFGTAETNVNGADAVPEKTTGATDPKLAQSSE